MILPEILEYAAEPLLEGAMLHRPAPIKGDTLRILPQTDQAEPEVRFEPLLSEV